MAWHERESGLLVPDSCADDELEPGVCRECGCTDDDACIDEDGAPCQWADTTRALCSRCA